MVQSASRLTMTRERESERERERERERGGERKCVREKEKETNLPQTYGPKSPSATASQRSTLPPSLLTAQVRMQGSAHTRLLRERERERENRKRKWKEGVQDKHIDNLEFRVHK